MKIKELVNLSSQSLAAISTSARLDAELLLSHVINKPRIFIYTDPNYELSAIELNQFQELIAQRQQGKPIAYILGTQAFWNFELKITQDVLIPRPETEGIVEKVLKILPEDKVCRVVDLGTGSGAIAIALALERPLWQLTAVDVSVAALRLAKENASNLGIKTIKFVEGHWFTTLEKQPYDCIVTNPPYIAEDDPELSENVRKYEPQIALIAGKTGLECIEEIARLAKKYLKTNGYLVIEHGFQQAKLVRQLLEIEGYKEITEEKDLAGLVRVITAKTHFS